MVREFSDVERERIPAWYDLRVNRYGIAVDLHPQAFNFLVERFANGFFESQEHRISSEYRPEGYPLPKFISPREPKKPWGFGGNAVPIPPSRKGWIAYAFQPPKYDRSGPSTEWYQPSATLAHLFMAIRFPEFRTDFDKPQLLVVTGLMAMETRFYAGALEASVSPALFPWMKQYWPARVGAVRLAMREMWNRIYDKDQRAQKIDRFEAYFNQPKWLVLDCPGNATGIGAEMTGSSFADENEGYTLQPHNTDHPGQQWSLLAGVAKIYELARADGF